MPFHNWSATANDNGDADITAGIDMRENLLAAKNVNNSVRALMAELAKWRDDNNGSLLTTGTATAYVVATNQDISGEASIPDGFTLEVTLHAANGAAATIAVDGQDAVALHIADGVALPTGQFSAGARLALVYHEADDVFYAHGVVAATANEAKIGTATDRFPSVADVKHAAFPAGTRMLFQQTAAPTGWTKDTTHDNKALRVVSGSVVNGGTAAFTTAFASRTPAGTVGNTALTVAQIPSHNHFTVFNATAGAGGGNVDANNAMAIFLNSGDISQYLLKSGGFPPTLGPTSNKGDGDAHTHSFTGTAMDFAVAYVDLIIAAKDAAA